MIGKNTLQTMTTEGLQFHNLQLLKHCRVCGKYCVGETTYSVAGKTAELRMAFGLPVDKDKKGLHPPQFCQSCYCCMKRACNAKDHQTSTTTFYWSVHTDNCLICEHFRSSRRVGRPKKGRKSTQGRPSVRSLQIRDISRIAPSSLPVVQEVVEYHLPPDSPITLTDIECVICMGVLVRPLQLPCGSICCTTCMCDWVKHTPTIDPLSCPCCPLSHSVQMSQLHPAPQVLMKLLDTLLITCLRCGGRVPATKHKDHIESGCKLPPQESVPETIEDLLSQPPCTPLAPLEKRAMQHSLLRLFSSSPPESQVLTVPTSGRPLTLVRVPKAATTTTDAGPKTASRRTKALEMVRDVVSGGDCNRQLQLEVKRLPREDRQQLLRSAGLNLHVPEGQGLAMKCDVGLPWNKLRALRKWLKMWGVSMAGEGKERKVAKVMIHDEVQGEEVPFSFPRKGGEEMRTSALVFLECLEDHLLHLLDENNLVSRLTWHDTLPEEEIWVKLGGDKGGSCMKVHAQLCNVLLPNSPKNTSVFTAFEAPDTAVNLHIALSRYQDQVLQLQSLMWSGKRIRVFLSGDYEFLCRMYGLSGAAGRHCCLWCEIPTDKLKVPLECRGFSHPRSLNTLKHDFERFVRNGANIKTAKLYNNVVHEYIWDIPIDQVCLPALHISLGVFYRLYTLLEQASHELDLAMAREKSDSGRLGGGSFEHYSSLLQRLHKLQEERDAHEQAAQTLDQFSTRLALCIASEDSAVDQLNYVAEMTASYKRKAEELGLEIDKISGELARGFKLEDGPFNQGLDRALKSFRVERQAYYGGTFVGNHVHKCLKPENITTLCKSVVTTAQRDCPTLTEDAESLCQQFTSTFTLFSACHRLYTSKLLTEEDVNCLDTNIKTFLLHYRTIYPHATVTPKLHLLEDHMVPWIRKWGGVGFGMMGEQGAESIHAEFNTIEERHRNQRHDRVERLRRVLIEHLTKSSPQNVAALPPSKRRKS